MSMFDDDIVRDILRRAVEVAQRSGGFDEVMAVQIERQVRQDWAGERPYIASHAAADRAERVQKAWDDGEHNVARLAVRFGLTQRRILQILGR